MKKVLLCVGLMLLVGGAIAQNAQKRSTTKKQSTNKNTILQKKARQKKDTTATQSTITLSSTSNNRAFANGYSANRFQITDPTLQALNAKAAGANIKFKGSPMIGVPKGTYGFANGKLTLYSNGSTSSGTINGNGSVGTGTSPGAIGGFGPGVGVNGKSPFVGPGAYGTRIPVFLKPPDSTSGFGIKKRF